MIELCRQHNTVDSFPMFRKLFSLLVLSGLFFPRSAWGVAWELIDLVKDVDHLGDYNWVAALVVLSGCTGGDKGKDAHD